jgi:hypothetical protein
MEVEEDRSRMWRCRRTGCGGGEAVGANAQSVIGDNTENCARKNIAALESDSVFCSVCRNRDDDIWHIRNNCVKVSGRGELCECTT